MKSISLFMFMVLTGFSSPVFSQQEQVVKFISLSWSPDGKRLVFSAISVKPDWSDYSTDNWRLLLFDYKTERIELVEKAAVYGVIDSCGNHIVFEKYGDNREVYVKSLETGKLINLTNSESQDGAPVLSLISQKLAFNSDRAGGREIFVLDPRCLEAEPMRVTHAAPYKSCNPEWSPDGRRLVYYLEKGDHKDQIWVTDVAGDNPHNISNDTLQNYYPAWTPDGKIIYTGPDDRIFVMNPDGSNKKPLPGVHSFFARVSPKKKRIAYISKDDDAIVIAKYPRLGQLKVISGENLKSRGFW